MSLNLVSTMMTLRQTLALKNDPDLARNNQNSHVTITYTCSATQVLVERRWRELTSTNVAIQMYSSRTCFLL